MATTSKSTAAEPPTEPDPETVAQEQAKVHEQADKDRDELARAAQDAPGPTPIPANFEDAAAYGRVSAERAEQAKADESPQSVKPDGEAQK